MDTTPMRVWTKWKAWFRFQGPRDGLGEDLRAAALALEMAKPYIKPEERVLTRFLPPGRLPSDYRPWGIDLGPDPQPEHAEYVPD